MNDKSPTTNRHKVYLQALVRISKIHEQIASGSFPSVRQLAENTGVNERTVKRDLDVLRYQLNAPIIYERKKKGFRYAEIGWTLPLTNFEEKEFLAVFIAENALKLTGHLPEAQDLKKALAKLVSYLPEKVSMDLATLSDSISFQNPAYELSEPEVLNKLAASANNLSTIEFDYFSPHSQQSSHRKVDVYLLHNFGGDWYAVSYCHDRRELRDFHIGRITNLKETNEGFEIKKEIWNKKDYLRKGFQMTRGGRMTKVVIWFDPYQAQWIRKRKHFHPDEEREELPDKSLRLSFEIGENGLEAVARFCTTYAGNCIAEKPKKLREIVREKLQKGMDLHQ
jgi:predicted DNA-binding transcriptional regulator YafY